MEIRKINKSIEEIIGGATYLGNGASKEAYSKNGVVYKVPRGRYIIQNGEFGDKLTYPDTIDEVDDFLEEVDSYDPSLVWPLGQFATELIVWNALLQLEREGYDLKYFARIKDYYLDKNGVIVIEQEEANDLYDRDNEEDEWEEFRKEIDNLSTILEERFNIALRDIREGNCGYTNKGIKLFDFGISTTTSLDSYGSYSDFSDCSESEYYSYDDCHESTDCLGW